MGQVGKAEMLQLFLFYILGLHGYFHLRKTSFCKPPPPTILGTYLHLEPSKEIVTEVGE